MDFKKIFAAVKLPIVMGLALLLILGILSYLNWTSYLPPLRTNIPVVNGLIFLVFLAIFLYLPFFCLFLWAGYHATKKYSLSLIESGAVAALSCLVIGIIETTFTLLFVFILPHFFPTILPEDPKILAANGILTPLGIAFGIGLGIFASLLSVSVGTVINFIVGMIGSFIASRISDPVNGKN